MILQAKKREKLGKSVNSLRREGFLPAVIYGHNTENLNLLLSTKEFEKLYYSAGESSILKLQIEGENDPRNVLIHDIMKHYLNGSFIHADFYQVKMDEKVKTKVVIEFTGEAPAVKNGNVLVKNIHDVEIESLPANLPKSIVADISGLKEIGDKITVGKLILPQGVKSLTDPEIILISIEAPRAKEEEVKPAAEQIITDIKAITDEKREKKDKEKQEPASK